MLPVRVVLMRRSSELVTTWGWAAGALAAYALLWHNFLNPVLRLWHPAANQLFFLVGLSLPWMAAWRLMRARPVALRAIALLVLAIPCLWSGLWMLLAGSNLGRTLRSGHDGSFEPIAELATPGGRLRAYRTNGGATTDFGVVIREEKGVFPGLYRVRRIDSRYHTYGARLERLPQHRVRVIWNANDADFAGPLLTPDPRGWYHVSAAGPPGPF